MTARLRQTGTPGFLTEETGVTTLPPDATFAVSTTFTGGPPQGVLTAEATFSVTTKFQNWREDQSTYLRGIGTPGFRDTTEASTPAFEATATFGISTTFTGYSGTSETAGFGETTSATCDAEVTAGDLADFVGIGLTSFTATGTLAGGGVVVGAAQPFTTSTTFSASAPYLSPLFGGASFSISATLDSPTPATESDLVKDEQAVSFERTDSALVRFR